jgi:hypothetical protein
MRLPTTNIPMTGRAFGAAPVMSSWSRTPVIPAL